MRKTLSLVLVVILCFLLCACGDKTQIDNTITEVPLEVISEDTLFLNITNGAKCQLNVGKQVTVLGQITNISSENCRIKLISYPKQSVLIRMPLEKLAELYVGQFIAAVSIVESYSDSGVVGYTLSATETMDIESMDAVFRENVAFKYDNDKSVHFVS